MMLAMVVLLGTSCTTEGTSQPITTTSSATTQSPQPPTASVKAPSTSASSSAVGPITDAVTNGDYIIGTDIAAGVWQCRSSGDSLYWETTDRTGEIIDNDLGSIARVNADAFAVKLKGCLNDWVAVDAEPTSTTSLVAPEPTSGTGSPTRDTNIANCRTMFAKFTDADRAAIDAAIPIGRISGMTLWGAVQNYRSLAFRSGGTPKIFDAANRLNDAALVVSYAGPDMPDAVTQEFMQSYYELRTFCEEIKAWN